MGEEGLEAGAEGEGADGQLGVGEEEEEMSRKCTGCWFTLLGSSSFYFILIFFLLCTITSWMLDTWLSERLT